MAPTALQTPMTTALWSSIHDLTSPPKEEPRHWPCEDVCQQLSVPVKIR